MHQYLLDEILIHQLCNCYIHICMPIPFVAGVSGVILLMYIIEQLYAFLFFFFCIKIKEYLCVDRYLLQSWIAKYYLPFHPAL